MPAKGVAKVLTLEQGRPGFKSGCVAFCFMASGKLICLFVLTCAKGTIKSSLLGLWGLSEMRLEEAGARGGPRSSSLPLARWPNLKNEELGFHGHKPAVVEGVLLLTMLA